MTRPFIWAHRGTSARAPENTMAAFGLALEQGVDGIELDIHLSQDGVPVVIHDETLARTTDGEGRIAEASWLELQQLDAGRWFSKVYAGEPIPPLESVLKTFGGLVRLNLEVKDFDAGMAVLDLLSGFPAADVVVSSFNHDLLSQVRLQNDKIPVAVLYDQGNWYRALALAAQLRAIAFHPRATAVTRPMVAACKHLGLPVHAWTVDDPGLARRLMRAGVTGFFANDPKALKKAIPEELT
ncbi:MAG: glycerophosphodiester phosphodiesterase family protein [Desulfuromonadales bacterium]|nr:glycerophosphodiester phosphodiesterase family protein [Desulfuromonadales bacterium]